MHARQLFSHCSLLRHPLPPMAAMPANAMRTATFKDQPPRDVSFAARTRVRLPEKRQVHARAISSIMSHRWPAAEPIIQPTCSGRLELMPRPKIAGNGGRGLCALLRRRRRLALKREVEEVGHQENHKNRSQADASAASITVAAIPVIATSATDKQDQNNDDQDSHTIVKAYLISCHLTQLMLVPACQVSPRSLNN